MALAVVVSGCSGGQETPAPVLEPLVQGQPAGPQPTARPAEPALVQGGSPDRSPTRTPSQDARSAPTPWVLQPGMEVPREGASGEPAAPAAVSAAPASVSAAPPASRDAFAPPPSAEVSRGGSSPGAPPTVAGVPRLAEGVGPAAEPPPQAMIGGTTHVYQKWNNCGPSTVLMAISAFGVQRDQLEVATHLKPDREDTNVSPEELASYARGQGLEARVRYGGDRFVVRRLVAAGVPVIAEQWIDVEHRGEMGHYRVVIGYDDAAGEFTAQDSYYGPRRTFSYEAFEAMWQPFSGAYVVAYPAASAGAVEAAIGADGNDDLMWRRVEERAIAYSAAHPDLAWSWFSLGEVRARRGDAAGAVEALDKAIAIGLPFRAFWYQFGYSRALHDLGAYDRLLEHTEKILETMKGENLEESHFWRGMALRGMGNEAEARASFERALFFNPLYEPAREALAAEPGG